MVNDIIEEIKKVLPATLRRTLYTFRSRLSNTENMKMQMKY